MARLEQRLERLEAGNAPDEQIAVIVRQIIRPGDLVCIAEIRRVIGKEPVGIEFPEKENSDGTA